MHLLSILVHEAVVGDTNKFYIKVYILLNKYSKKIYFDVMLDLIKNVSVIRYNELLTLKLTQNINLSGINFTFKH